MVLADKGGVPNEKAANGLAHANENSAHHKNAEPPPSASCDTCGCTLTSSGWCEANSGEDCPCDGGIECGAFHADPATCIPGDATSCNCLPRPITPLPF